LDNRESIYNPGDKLSLTYKNERITVEIIDGDYTSKIFVLDDDQDKVVLPYQIITHLSINLPDCNSVRELALQNGNPNEFFHEETKLWLVRSPYYAEYRFADSHNREKLILPGSLYKYPNSKKLIPALALCRILSPTSVCSCCPNHNKDNSIDIPSISDLSTDLSIESKDQRNNSSPRASSSSDLDQNYSEQNNNSFAWSNENQYSSSTFLLSCLSRTPASSSLRTNNSLSSSAKDRLKKRTTSTMKDFYED
jgi:hypothetical protein